MGNEVCQISQSFQADKSINMQKVFRSKFIMATAVSE